MSGNQIPEAYGQAVATVFDAFGNVSRIVKCPENMVGIQCMDGESFELGEFSGDSFYRGNDGVAEYTSEQADAKRRPPTGAVSWSNSTMSWNMVDDAELVELLKIEAWSRIKSARESVEFGPFTFGGNVFDGDSESQRRIQGAAQLATLAQATSQPFSIDWTLADNTQATLTAAEMIGVGVALGQHVNGAHGIARSLRTQIDAATTPEELEAIQWPV